MSRKNEETNCLQLREIGPRAKKQIIVLQLDLHKSVLQKASISPTFSPECSWPPPEVFGEGSQIKNRGQGMIDSNAESQETIYETEKNHEKEKEKEKKKE